MELGLPDQQEAMDKFLCLCGRCLFRLDVCFVLLYHRCIGGGVNGPCFFTVIGMNSITIYFGAAFSSVFSYTSEAIFGGLAKLMPETAQPLVSAIAYIRVFVWGISCISYIANVFS